MSSKKILAVINNVWPPPVIVTGISIIYRYLVCLADKGYEVHILTSKGLWDKNSERSKIDEIYDVEAWFREQKNKKNIHFHTYDLRKWKMVPRLVFFINRFIPLVLIPRIDRREQFDIIHEFTSTPLLIYRSWFLKKLLGKKVKIIHSIIGELPGKLGSAKWLSKFHPNIDKVICVSDRIYKNVLATGYDKERLAMISLGVDAKKFDNLPNSLTLKKAYGLTEKDVVFMFLAPLESHKGPEVFTKAAVEFLTRKTSEDVKFIIVTYDSPGQTPYKKRLSDIRNIITGQETNIRIFEGIFDVAELMAICDAVVVPQTTVDGATGHPVTLLEAMCAGKIVLASDMLGITEIIKDKYTGFLFTNHDYSQLAELYKHIVENIHDMAHIKHAAKKEVATRYDVKTIAGRISDEVYD